MEEDPSYTRWERMIFPARKDGADGWDTLFPELYDREWYEFQRKSLGPYSAAALLDCNPRTAGTALFHVEWLQYYATEPDARRLKIHIFVDGAKAKSSTADYTCILVLGRAADRCTYWLDGVHARLNLAEKIAELYRLKAKWQPKITWWEQVGPMSDVEALRLEMDRRMDRFVVRELKHTTNKDFRIRKLVVPLANGEFVMPSTMVRQRKREDGSVETYDMVHEMRDGELLPYTGAESTPHDDIIDCLADTCDEEVMREFTPPSEGYGGGGRTATATMERYRGRFGR